MNPVHWLIVGQDDDDKVLTTLRETLEVSKPSDFPAWSSVTGILLLPHWETKPEWRSLVDRALANGLQFKLCWVGTLPSGQFAGFFFSDVETESLWQIVRGSDT